MKKFLAAVMAAAMVVSMTAVASFATAATYSKVAFTLDSTTAAGIDGNVKFTVTPAGGASLSAPIVFVSKDVAAGATVAAVAAAFNGAKSADAKFIASTAGSVITVTQVADMNYNLGTAPTAATAAGTSTGGTHAASTIVGSGFVQNGTASTDFDSGALAVLNIDGPYVDDTANIFGEIVRPGQTMYYRIDQNYAASKDIKLTLKKGDSSKNIESVKLVEKDLGLLTLVAAPHGTVPDANRQYYVAVKLRDKMTDSEYKVNFKIKATAKKEIAASSVLGNADIIPAGAALTETTFDSAWVNNQTITGSDLEFPAGRGGVVAKPVKDDNNTVTWSDANRDLAKMVFTADSAVNVYYPKLSTAWDNEFYGMHFATDAFKFEFVGNPTISATARPVLTLMNPFIVEDEYTVDAADLTVYELVDGALVDATGRFTATEDEEGNQVLVTKTRTLGTYVVTDAEAVMTAAEEEVVAPEKLVPNTGR